MKNYEVKMRCYVIWRVDAESEDDAIDKAYAAMEEGRDPYDISPSGDDRAREVKP